MMSGEGKVVCVTGASGYIASWLVKLLLQCGYTVKATVRNPNDSKKTEHLHRLDGAKERLHLFKADLVEEGSFDRVVDGCDGVFHTACPVNLSPNDPQKELIEPAVKGTLNVLKSCSKVPSIKRVVLTSSIVSATYTGKPLTPDAVVDETWFSDPAFCESNKLWYQLAKTLAEDAAWNFAKENGIDVVTLHPGHVLGPLLLSSTNYSTEWFLKMINGLVLVPNGIYGFVDVRDVASAHILALERSSANGRYLLIGRVAHISEVAKILHEHFPRLHFPEKLGGEKPLLAHGMSKEKAETLGLSFTPLEVSVTDTIKSLQEKNLLDV